MSTVQDTPVPAATTEPVATPAVAAPEASVEPKVDSEAPVAAAEPTAETTAPATEEVKTDAAEKAVEPIAEGQLAYKGPGLVKSLIPSKKEFWLSDDAVVPQNLDLYLRGEKPEVSHAVVAWASQTGKGLLFFNKKGDSDKTHPADVLALYEATDLKKEYPTSFSFKINGHSHTFKAEDELKRDGWYLSIEKAIELGKASKEEVRESEGYKAEIEKLNKPNTLVAGAATRSLSKPKKSTEVPAEPRTTSSDGETDEKKKDQKSRSTSRGILNRLKGHKDEAEQKVAEKKEEKAEKEEAKAEGEAAPVADTTESAPIAAAMAAEGSPAAAEASASEEKPAETPVADEKVRPSKRGSIFGRVSSTWSKIQSPAKEKDQKEAELKPEPAKDAVVSENPPVLPETTTASTEVADTAIPAVEEPKTEEVTEAKKEEPAAASPTKEKNNFLSGIGGFIKRNRSVSPSTHMKEPAKKEETPAVEEPAAAEPVAKIEEPATEAAVAVEPSAETPAEKVEEPKTETTTPNKRQSVLGSLGRRASKALNRIQAPKKESPAPAATEAKKEEAAETKPTEETPVVNGEAKQAEPEAQQSIGDVVPDAVNVGQPQHQTTPTVTATA